MGEKNKIIRIGGASGFWGDATHATAQLLADGDLDYLVYDYLAEITMSIMARARAADPAKGFATDFVSAALKPNLKQIAQQGTKVLTNAGGVNVHACAAAVQQLVDAAGLSLKVAAISGDDLIAQKSQFQNRSDMFSGAAFPASETVASINAYLGAAPIAEALQQGADIVITGRCADSALTLAACMHAFSWQRTNWDQLAAGSLAGHLLECGVQATGGNFTDWRDVECSMSDIGYPIAEMQADGRFVITKPAGSGGIVSRGTVAEQLLYEIDDPQCYRLPDVIADFSEVVITELGSDRVEVSGALGRPCTDTYKVSTTYADGYRIGVMWSFCGLEAEDKARRFAEVAVHRSEQILRKTGAPGFRETNVEILGTESQFGDFRQSFHSREVVLKLAAWHDDARACGLLLKTLTGLALATPPGLTTFNAGRPKPQPVVRLFSCLYPKADVPLQLHINGHITDLETASGHAESAAPQPHPAPCREDGEDFILIPLWKLAWGRSGDKGNLANIGIIARDAQFLPWIWAGLTEKVVRDRFAHFLQGDVHRYYLPGCHAINFVLHDVLGGGGIASLRNDPQGKAYAQILLSTDIALPASLAARTS